MKKIVLLTAFTTLGALAQAQMTPVGVWHSIDDATNKPKAVIRISTNASGALSGVVEKALNPDPKAEPNCVKCTDDRKDKPKVGMEIIRGGKKKPMAKTCGKTARFLTPTTAPNTACASPPSMLAKSLKCAATWARRCWAAPKPGCVSSEPARI